MKARYRFTAWERLGLAPKRQRREARGGPLASHRGPSRAVNPLGGSLAGLLLFASAGLGFGQTVSLEGAIAGALEGIRQKAPAGAVAAVAQFQADSPKLSDYVLGELASGLVSRGRVKVVERQQINMDMVQKSLAFDMTGMVSDESAQFIGHFLGAQYLITGSLMDVGNGYRFRVEMVQVETAEKVQSYTATIDKGDRQVYALTDARYETVSALGGGRAGGSGTKTTSDTGIWVGIVSFGPTAEDLTGGPVFLDREGLETLQGILDKKYQKSRRQGTALYYGVHQVLAALSAHAGQFPDNLDSVNVLTFTDGLDNGSTNLMLAPLEGQDFAGEDGGKYQEYLAVQIKNRPVRGRSITAFSAGVRGSDVSDGRKFTGTLQSLASSPGHFYELTNFTQLNERFGKIADELTITKRNTTFRLVTPGYGQGTKIRMTFDGAARGEDSKRYLEGTVGIDRRQRAYILQEIRYEGVSSSAGPQVRAIMDDTEVVYVFEDFEGYEAGQRVRQWSREPLGTSWQVNSEYTLGESVRTTTEYKSAVVYLTLDSSTSLSDGDVGAIRDAAKGFIRTLYEKSRGESAEQPGTLVVEAAAGGTVSISGPGVNQSVSISAGQTLRQSYPSGTYTVRLKYEDGKEESRTVSLTGKEEGKALFSYRPAETGTLAVEAAAGGTVSIAWNGVSQSVSIAAGGRYRQSYPAGTYTVRIRYEDGTEESRTVSLAGKGETVARFSYRPVETGTLAVQAATGGTVSITGPGVSQSVSISPGQTLRQNYPAGTYTVRIRYGDGKEESRTVSLAGKRETAAGFTYRPAAIPAGFVRVEGGTFQMGGNESDREKPIHPVTVSGFYMGKYEVTQEEWGEVMGSNPSNFKGRKLPVENVSWYDAIDYCNRRSIKEGLTPAYSRSGDTVTWNRSANGYRLPTEAEWEYAARGGVQSRRYVYAGSNNAGDVGWYDGNSGSKTHEVGTKGGNELGLYDMSGNVWEWCWDWYGGYSLPVNLYNEPLTQTDPVGPASGSSRVLRGGSWYSRA